MAGLFDRLAAEQRAKREAEVDFDKLAAEQRAKRPTLDSNWWDRAAEEIRDESGLLPWETVPERSEVWEPNTESIAYSPLVGVELAAVEAYWSNMTSRPELWWNIQFGDPDEQGFRSKLITPLRMSNTNLEQGTQAKGFSDQQIGWLAEKLNSGPEQLVAPGEDELLWGQPGGPGGGGGGAGGPKYVGPMREVIEDTVKSMLTALTGDEAENLVQKYSDMYGKAHRQQWDVARKGGTDVDPNQVVLEAIRGQEDYQRIHTLRSESESETRWISDRVARLTQLGVTSQDADDRAVWLAQTGTNLNDIDTGAAQMVRGRKDITLFDKIGKAAELVAG
ncbi:hypothetical protein LCGC14_2996550, partial [marine sediment metagenome]